MTTVAFELKRLPLRHVWSTTMSSSSFRETVHLWYTRDGVTGYGEGAPIARYGATPQDTLAALETLRPLLQSADPWHFVPLLAECRRRLPHFRAGLAAIDLALHDWAGKMLGAPTHRLFGLDPRRAPLTSFSIGIDTPELTRQKTREAAAFPVLKIKVGLASDETTLQAVRDVTDKPLRVDANEGWTNVEAAVRNIHRLEEMGAELIEQPMPAGMTDAMRAVRARVKLPIFADEACTSAEVIPSLVGAYDGINVKLDKAGGLLEARRWIDVARACGLQVMLGCMVSSSLSTTAAAQLASLADFVDLDGALLLADDPYLGMTIESGRILLPEAPGLGVTPRALPPA